MENTPMNPETKVDVETVEQAPFKRKILWRYVIKYIILHVGGLYGLLLSVTTGKIWTIVFSFVLMYLTGLGLSAGAHRLWAHRSFKAKWPLRLLLAIFNTMAFDKSIHEYCVDHRVHHKYSETDCDPHTIKEGFFFSQIGWRMMSQRPQFKEKKSKVDLTDVRTDPFVVYQKRYWIPLTLILAFVLPALIPFLMWGEDPFTALFVCGFFRWMVTSHIKWTVNSVAHRWGDRPYDKTKGNACDNKLVVWAAFGEGFHNYHHTFPFDYKTSELDWKYNMNMTLAFIDFFALIGLAYDLKTASPEMIEARRQRTGEPLDPNAKPKKWNILEWILAILLFLFPLAFWISVNILFNYIFYSIYHKSLHWNLHDYVMYYGLQLACHIFELWKEHIKSTKYD